MTNMPHDCASATQFRDYLRFSGFADQTPIDHASRIRNRIRVPNKDRHPRSDGGRKCFRKGRGTSPRPASGQFSPIHSPITGPYFTTSPANTTDTIEINLIMMFNDGPDVSLKGSPTVSPTTVAL